MKLKFVLLASLFLSFNASAADLKAKSGQFCEKIQTCIMQSMGTSGDGSPEIASIKPMIDGMCQQLTQSVVPQSEKVPEALESDIAVCMDSILALSCDVLMSGQSETPACQSLERKAKKYQ